MEVSQEILPWEMSLIERICGDRRFHDATVFTEHGGRLALIHKPSDPPGAFWAVTGGLEPGEELSDAVEREAYEETGLVVEPLCYVLRMKVSFTSEERRRPWTSHVFLAGLRQAAPPSGSAPPSGPGRAGGPGQVGGLAQAAPLYGSLQPIDVREVERAEWISLDRFRSEVVPVLWTSGWGRFRYRLTLTRCLFEVLGWEPWEWEPPARKPWE